jgi:hypothetical protein
VSSFLKRLCEKPFAELRAFATKYGYLTGMRAVLPPETFVHSADAMRVGPNVINVLLVRGSRVHFI